MASMSSVRLHTFLASDSRLTIPVSENPQLSVILVLFNRAELTLACLRSLSEDAKRDLELVIVDNASTDETARLIDRIDGAKIVRNSHNEGFLSASNQGAATARGKNLLFLNNDTEVFPGAIASALHTLESTDDAGAVAGKLIYPDGTLQEAGGIIWKDGSCSGYGNGDDPFAGPYMYRRDVDYCSGAFLLTRRDLFEDMNGFDESFKPAYYEDTDYCLRLRERQLRVVYDPDAIVQHHEFASSPSRKDAVDLQERHRKIFAKRHERSLTQCLARSELNITKARSAIRDESRILFIDDRVPHPSRGSGYPRSHTILTGLLEKGHFVTVYPLAQLDENWTSIYDDIPRSVEVMSGMGARRLEEFLKARPGYYETVVVSRPHNMQVVNMVIRAHPDWFRKTLVIYDAEALATTREVRRRELRGENVSEVERRTLLENEVDLAVFADSVIAVSESEKEAFAGHGVDHVFELGHVVPPRPTQRGFEERSGFLFVGAIYGDLTSNADAVRWFVEEIFPRISESLGPEVTLAVVGHNESEEIHELASERVRILGRVDEITDFYDRCRVFIAPTRFAAGLPHKIHEAAANGIPAVATSLLAEQLGWNDLELGVADDAEGFALKCVELYQDQDIWHSMRTAALDRVASDCSTEQFDARLQSILSNREKRQIVVPPSLEWTGERFLPWIDEATIAYEHLHRYAYAAQFVKGKRVLDLASGEGYGADILARSASSVVGIDVDETAIRHANMKYGRSNLSFLSGSITHVPIPDDHSFDVIVCFEGVEHVDDHEALIGEALRLMSEDGLLIVSTPNTKTYTKGSEDPNPFHTRELSLEELQGLLDREFRHTRYLGQRTFPTSNIWPNERENSGAPAELFIKRETSDFTLSTTDDRVPLYYLALASNVPTALEHFESILIDPDDALGRQHNRQQQALQDEIDAQRQKHERVLGEKDQAIDQKDQMINGQEGTIASRDETIRERDQAIREQDETLKGRDQDLAANERAMLQQGEAHAVEKSRLNSDLTTSNKRAVELEGELSDIKRSRGWRMVRRWRALVETVFPIRSHQRNFLEYWRKHLK
jgi:GT2 family glycosyltransferase/2-polyprenyl-3-methyl-5-hydroxy-6-metoxy-1,4-benzoquinol methylase